MKVLCFGSLNIDYTYHVDSFVKEGETISAKLMETFCGGKGLNQSVALSRAGAEVWHAGVAGVGGQILLDALKKDAVNLEYLKVSQDVPNGQAIIQLDDAGRNCIIVYPGSNALVSCEYADEVLEHFDTGDYIVLQNEIPNLDYIIRCARQKGMVIFLNPSPITDKITLELLRQTDYLLINEVEGRELTGGESFEQILDSLQERCPQTKVVLTVGENGVLYRENGETLSNQSYRVPVADTTAAGDTFSGYFIASISRGVDTKTALRYASMAAAICVSRKGASPSIPQLEEVYDFEKSA